MLSSRFSGVVGLCLVGFYDYLYSVLSCYRLFWILVISMVWFMCWLVFSGVLFCCLNWFS